MTTRPPGSPGEPSNEGVIASGGVRWGYVRSGAGKQTIVLLHGWPQTSHAWRKVRPLLLEDYTIITFDLPGVGRSSAAGFCFEKATMADSLHAAMSALHLESPVLVGHDIGAMVAHALARRHPAALSGLVIVDTPLPGIAGWEETVGSSAHWHIRFHQDVDHRTGIADALVEGREVEYFRRFIDRFAVHREAITADDIAVYAQGYGTAEQLAAGFGMFRAFPLDVAENKTLTGSIATPTLLAFAEYSNATVLDAVADGLRQSGVLNVYTALIHDSGHWPAEEQSVELAEIIRDFASSAPVADPAKPTTTADTAHRDLEDSG